MIVGTLGGAIDFAALQMSLATGTYDIAGTLGNGSWGYIVGTYDEDAGTNNQRLYLNGARVAQMSDGQPIDLNSASADT